MGEYSKYPNSIDTTTELPKATNLVTPVNSEFVNRLRDAIIAIETELGIQPSGTFSTTRARLDAIDAAFRTLGTEVSDIDPTIEILQESASINANANAINFTGNVAVTDAGDGVNVEIIGGQATQVQETFIATDGQTSFTLSEIPFQTNGVHMYVNGVKMRYAADYTVSDTTVSYLDDVALISGDEVEFWYLVDSTGLVSGSSSLIVRDEGVLIDSAVSALNLTGDFTVTSVSPGVVQVAVTSPTLAVQDEGVSVDASVTTLNFTGDIAVTNPTPGTISVAVSTAIDNPWNTTDQTITDSGTFTIQSGLNTVITATNNVSISATGVGIYFDATAGGEFYPSAEYIYIESLGWLDMVSEDGITMYQIRRTGDLPAQAIHLQGAQASATAVGATNRTGGSLIFEAGAATTPGTDESGPIYFGLGTAVTNTIANGIKFGHGAAVGALGDVNYVPYTTEVGKVSVTNSAFTLNSIATDLAINSGASSSLYLQNDGNNALRVHSNGTTTGYFDWYDVTANALALRQYVNSVGEIYWEGQAGTTGTAFSSPRATGKIAFRLDGSEILQADNFDYPGDSVRHLFLSAAGSSAFTIYARAAGDNMINPAAGSGFSIRPSAMTGDSSEAPAMGIKGADASTTATTAARQRGGSLWFETGRGTTPGTHAAGPVYLGLGDAVGTSVTNGFILGYGAAVNSPGNPDYIPYTTELARHTLTSDEYKVNSAKSIRISSSINAILEGSSGAYLTGSSAVVITGGGTGINATASGACQLYSTASYSRLAAAGAVELLSGNRSALFGHYADGIARVQPRWPVDVATASVAKTALTTIAIGTSKPSSFRGSVAGWPAGGGAQFADIVFHAENVGGTVTIYGSTITGSGASLGTITIEASGANAIVYVTPGAATAYTWRCTLIEER